MKKTTLPPALLPGFFPSHYYLVIEPRSALLRHPAGFVNYDDARRIAGLHSGAVVTNCNWLRANFGSFGPLVRYVITKRPGALVARMAEAADFATLNAGIARP